MALYDILFSGGNLAWYGGWADGNFGSPPTFFDGNQLHGGHDLSIEEFRSREYLWDFSYTARRILQGTVPFWLGAPDDGRVTNEVDDTGNPSGPTHYGGAEVLGSRTGTFPGVLHFYIVYYPRSVAIPGGINANYGNVDMSFMASDEVWSALFFDPRVTNPQINPAFADSRMYIYPSNLFNGMFTPQASPTMQAAFSATTPLEDVVLMLVRIQ